MAIVHGDVLRVTANFLLPGPVQYQNVYHYLYDGVGSAADPTVVDAIEAHLDLAYVELEDDIRNDILNDLSSVDVVEFVSGEWKVTRNVGTFTLTLAGIGSGETLPFQSSAFVTLKTTRPKSVGRKFLWPFIETKQAATVLVAGAVTDLVAYAAVILEDITVDIINALHPGIVRTGVDDYLVFSAAVVTNVLGSQRRRRPGEGA